EPPLAPDTVELPVIKSPEAGEASRPPAPEPPAVNPAVAQRLHYKSWDRAHGELVAAYKEKKDCRPKYEEVIASLKLLKEGYSGEQAACLEIYLHYYADLCEKTRTFTALPDKTTESDVLDELDVAARVIRKRFGPGK